MLKKFMGDPVSILLIEEIGVDEDFSSKDLDHQVKNLRNKEVASVKVLWRNT